MAESGTFYASPLPQTMGNECLAIPRSYTAFSFDRHLLAGLADGGIRRGATGN